MGKLDIDLGRLFPEWARIGDSSLRANVEVLWQQLWRQSEFDRLEDVPVSAKILRSHLPHAKSVVRMAALAADVVDEIHGRPLDRDVLIAGALVQDVGKLVEFAPSSQPPGFVSTELGTKLQHSMYSAHLALEIGLPLSVVHIMLAHSPSSALGPQSRECAVLYWIDQLDLSLMGEETWTRLLMHKHH